MKPESEAQNRRHIFLIKAAQRSTLYHFLSFFETQWNRSQQTEAPLTRSHDREAERRQTKPTLRGTAGPVSHDPSVKRKKPEQKNQRHPADKQILRLFSCWCREAESRPVTFNVSWSIVLQLSEALSELFFGHFLLFPSSSVLVPEHFQRNVFFLC